MRDIKVHKKENNNLCSINFLRDGNLDDSFLERLFLSLSNLAVGNIYVEMSRPNYSIDSIVHLLEEETTVKNLFIDHFELSFYHSAHSLNDHLLTALIECWHAFEHSLICFSFGSKDVLFPKNKSWQEYIEYYTCFVAFKGAEENVVWLGKSTNLDFPDMRNW